MRIVIMFVVAISMAACTKPNPNTCCVTQAQCEELGADELRPCETGQACRASTCVASECSTSVDCTSTDAPICVNNLCVATCVNDDECADVPDRPFCSTESTCVGCIDGSQCSASEAICDATSHACRGCSSDDECATGVCIEAEGLCASEESLLHVVSTGTDAGSCTRTSPCKTLGYALQQVSQTRYVVRIRAPFLSVEPQTLSVNFPLTLDGNGTQVPKPAGTPWLAITITGKVTIEGLVVGGTMADSDPSITVGAAGALRLGPGSIFRGGVKLNSGTLVARGTRFDAPVICDSGTTDADGCAFNAGASGANCQLTIRRSRFDSGGKLLAAGGGLVTVENSLFVQSMEFADSITITTVTPGSTFRFNTVVNTSGIDSDGQALFCDASLTVTSNVFAYASLHPMGFPQGEFCPSRFSLFDNVAVAQHTAGPGNKVAAPATFFANRAAKDFHLAPGSPALGAAEEGLGVSVDQEGRVRPSVSPDMGAYELP